MSEETKNPPPDKSIGAFLRLMAKKDSYFYKQGLNQETSIDVFDQQKLKQRLKEIHKEEQIDRKDIAVEMMKSLLSNPAYKDIPEEEIVLRAVCCADKLLNTLKVTAEVTEKLSL